MTITILQGDVVEQLRTLPDCSVQCVVTSPPYYGLRDYGIAGQIGMEETPEVFVAKIVEVFREVKRVLRDDGTLWLNFGDSYCGSWGNSGRRPELDNTPSEQREKNTEYFNRGGWDERRERPPSSYNIPGYKQKDLFGIPWMVAFALRADGWYLRSDIIWSKPNPMPESVTDRPTKAHEYVFLMTKSARYFYDADAIREDASPATLERNKYGFNGAFKGQLQGSPTEERWQEGRPIEKPQFGLNGRNRRTVWEIATQPTPEAHFATFPEALVEPCIKAGTSERGCCAVCGAPMERVVEKESPPIEVFTKCRVKEDDGDYLYTPRKNGEKVGAGQKYQNWRNEHPATTTGWKATCKCNADTVPCVVLDPFGGSGTTAKVARDLKRDCTLIELNPAYIKIAKNKLRLNEQLVF